MQFKAIAGLLLAATTVSVFTAAFAIAHPLPPSRQVFFEHGTDLGMNKPFTFDSNESGPPTLSDVLGKEKGSSIAIDAILRSEALMRGLSGNSNEFKNGLTLLLPTNQAFKSLGEIPEDLDTVMKRHFIAQTVTPAMMEAGFIVDSYEKLTMLRFTESSGKVYVQAGKQKPVEVRGQGTAADNGVYFLVDALFM